MKKNKPSKQAGIATKRESNKGDYKGEIHLTKMEGNTSRDLTKEEVKKVANKLKEFSNSNNAEITNTMEIHYNEYTGTPNYIDFISILICKICERDSKFIGLLGLNEGIEFRSKHVFPPLDHKIMKQPKDWNPHSIHSIFKAYDQLKEWINNLKKKEERQFRRYYKSNKVRISHNEILHLYIKKIIGVSYNFKNKNHKKLYDALRKRIQENPEQF